MRLGARKATLASVFTLAGSLALLLSGCGGTTSGPAADSQQILHLQGAGVTDVKTLDPPNATDVFSVEYASVIFPGLVVLNKDLQAEPWAAAAMPTVSADGLTWTFKVKPGLKWSDGTAINAKTYAYSMNRAENPCNAFGAAYYLYAVKDAAAFNGETCAADGTTVKGAIQTLIGDSITTPDDLTLQIQLATPATYFLYAMTYPTSYAVPEQLISQYGNKYTDHLVDNGGFGGDIFKVTKWDHTGHLVLHAQHRLLGHAAEAA